MKFLKTLVRWFINPVSFLGIIARLVVTFGSIMPFAFIAAMAEFLNIDALSFLNSSIIELVVNVYVYALIAIIFIGYIFNSFKKGFSFYNIAVSVMLILVYAAILLYN